MAKATVRRTGEPFPHNQRRRRRAKSATRHQLVRLPKGKGAWDRYLLSVTNAVVPDGIEVDDHPQGIPGGGLAIGLVVGAVIVLFIASGGTESVPPSPDETLPEIETVTEDAWGRLDLPGAAPLQAVALLGVDRGYVAAGTGPQFWWSDDGVTWELGAAPSGPRDVADITGYRQSVVAVGSATDVGAGNRPVVWRTDTGEEWEVIDIAGHERAALEGVVAGVGHVVAWGWAGSGRDFAPETEPVVLASADGAEWTEIAFPHGMRVHAVRFLANRWYVMGGLTGQPALFVSTDLTEWEELPPRLLPFGWVMTDLLSEGNALTANLLDLGSRQTRQWALDPDGTWTVHGPPTLGGPVVIHGDALDSFGVGSGRLFTGAVDWVDAGLAGEVFDVEGNVAVGSVEGQPAVWVRGSESEPVAAVVAGEAAKWESLVALGRGAAHGPWLVGGSWVVGVGTDWWMVSPEGGAGGIPDLAGMALTRIDRVGDEWVTLPTMMWSSDGTDWEQRAEPWPGAAFGSGDVVAVTETAGGALAVGFDERRLWTVSMSTDAGKTWDLVGESEPMTPVELIRPVPGGFTGLAALPRSNQQIVQTTDGRIWEPLMAGELVEIAEPPAVVTPDGRLMLLDSQGELSVPSTAVSAVVRGVDGRLAVVAAGSLWTEPPPGTATPSEWIEIPLDPRHGLSAADVRPLPQEDGMFVLAVDRGRVAIYGWSD